MKCCFCCQQKALGLLAATHPPFTLPFSAEEDAPKLCRVLHWGPCFAHASPMSETLLVRLCSEMIFLKGKI